MVDQLSLPSGGTDSGASSSTMVFTLSDEDEEERLPKLSPTRPLPPNQPKQIVTIDLADDPEDLPELADPNEIQIVYPDPLIKKLPSPIVPLAKRKRPRPARLDVGRKALALSNSGNNVLSNSSNDPQDQPENSPAAVNVSDDPDEVLKRNEADYNALAVDFPDVEAEVLRDLVEQYPPKTLPNCDRVQFLTDMLICHGYGAQSPKKLKQQLVLQSPLHTPDVSANESDSDEEVDVSFCYTANANSSASSQTPSSIRPIAAQAQPAPSSSVIQHTSSMNGPNSVAGSISHQNQNAISVPPSMNLPPSAVSLPYAYGPPSTPLLAPPASAMLPSALPAPHLMMSALQLPLSSVLPPWSNPFAPFGSNPFLGTPTMNNAPFTPSGPAPSMFPSNSSQQQNFVPTAPAPPLKQPSMRPSRGNAWRRRNKGATHVQQVVDGVAQIMQTFPHVDITIVHERLKQSKNVQHEVDQILNELMEPKVSVPLDPFAALLKEQNSFKLSKLDIGMFDYSHAFEMVERTRNGSRVNILEIYQLENRTLQRQFDARREQVALECHGMNCLVEQSLFHGTAFESISGILADGFNRSMCGKNGTMYGEGCYFSTSFHYSQQFAHATSTNGDRFMLICRVITGDYVQGQPRMKVLPQKLNTNRKFHSAVDSTATPSIYVVFHDASACPMYLIRFR